MWVITLATESGRRRSQSGEFATPSGEDNLPAVLDQESFAGQMTQDDEGYIANSDAGRMGKAVEYLVAAGCILTTRGKLNVSTSLVGDEGVDLVFFARGATATLAVQVKARMSDSKTVRTKDRFVTSVREATFAPRRDLDMLFVLADVTEGRYTKTWLVPSTVFAGKTKLRNNQTRRFSASVKATSQDQWTEFRLEPADLPNAILDRLAELT